MTLPAVCLFAYRRPIHLSRSWQSLAENAEATQTDLHVFLDGPKSSKDINKVLETRVEAKKIRGFKKIFFYEANSNLGLSQSILNGIKKVSQQVSSWIVLEDDLVVGKHFLKFMHDALRCYEIDPAVASIHGYVYPTSDPLPETFFLRGADCWGWGSWNRAWSHFEKDGGRLMQALLKSPLQELFTFRGSASYLNMLAEQIEGKNDSWAIRWYASAFLAGMFTLYPGRSLVQNIGLDASGTHCARSSKYDTELFQGRIDVNPQAVTESKAAREAFENFFRGKKTSRPEQRFRQILFKIKEKLGLV